MHMHAFVKYLLHAVDVLELGVLVLAGVFALGKDGLDVQCIFGNVRCDRRGVDVISAGGTANLGLVDIHGRLLSTIALRLVGRKSDGRGDEANTDKSKKGEGPFDDTQGGSQGRRLVALGLPQVDNLLRRRSSFNVAIVLSNQGTLDGEIIVVIVGWLAHSYCC